MIVQALCKNCGHGELCHKTIGAVSFCDALSYPNKCTCVIFEEGISKKEYEFALLFPMNQRIVYAYEKQERMKTEAGI
jgi:hypothetical protein